MGLEIEFEDDDSADPERIEDLGPRRRRWTAFAPPLSVPRPSLALAITAVAVGVTAVAGLNMGRTAQQARSRAVLHMAPSDSYIIDALPAASASSLAGPLAQSGTGTVERAILLRVLNGGPRPVTLLGGTLYAPDIAAARLVPDTSGTLKPGAVGTLRAVARISCGGGPREGADAAFAEVSFATVADIELRTADGQIRRVRIIVQQYSTYAIVDECGFPGSRT